MVQRLGSPLISTATLKMTALLACGVAAILGGPSLYAQFVAPKIEAVKTDDDQGIWKLPPPPRYLLQSADTSTEDKTASVPKPALASVPKAETVLMKPSAPSPSAALPAPPAAPPPAVAALGASDAPGSLPPLPSGALAPPIVPPPPAVQDQASPAARRIPAASPAPVARPAVPLPRAAAPAPVSHLRTAKINPSEAERPAPAKAVSAKPSPARAAAAIPAPRPPASKSAAVHAEAKATKPRPGQRVAQAKPVSAAQLGEATSQPAAPPPQSQRIPVLSNILDGINSAGQAITNAVPKF